MKFHFFFFLPEIEQMTQFHSVFRFHICFYLSVFLRLSWFAGLLDGQTRLLVLKVSGALFSCQAGTKKLHCNVNSNKYFLPHCDKHLSKMDYQIGWRKSIVRKGRSLSLLNDWRNTVYVTREKSVVWLEDWVMAFWLKVKIMWLQ